MKGCDLVDRQIQGVRFENCGEQAVAIVAVVTLHDGNIFDWAAYIGIGTSQNERECYEQVAERGNKLSATDAHYFCPHLPFGKFRS